jgi:predicted O-methyltransferase YrrM
MEKIKKLFTWPTEKPNVSESGYNWFGGDNAAVLGHIIEDKKPKYILEMGSWNGSGSTKFILNAALDAQVVCIDHWSTDENDYVQKEFNIDEVRKIWNHIRILFETFLVNTWDYQDRLIPVRAKTVDGLQMLGKLDIPFDLIYIDAHHDYESVLHDISVSYKLWPNAIIVGDDYTWPGVRQAAHEFADGNNLELVVIGNCWYYKNK